ncbi:hypothetical protein EsDP_00001763 [Epichloe bromicola]|uniref:Uncharacterized protein n=1 Tax=Epichloe bromicola TaxID=79588 RepID=A0ABQ0CIT6_9HYPO
MSGSVNPTASRPASRFESYAAPEPEPAMDCLSATEVAHIDAAEPEPSLFLTLVGRQSLAVSPQKLKRSPRPDSWADSIPEPNPEPELAAETEEFGWAQPRKVKKDKRKGKTEEFG